MTFTLPRTSKGFTLIEIIVTLVVVAIMGTMLVVFMGDSLARSVNPITMVQNQNKVNEYMERIVAKYQADIKSKTLDLSALKIWIETSGNYAAYVDSASATPVNFVANTETPCTLGAAGCYALKVTLQKGGITIVGLFTQ